MSVYLIRCKCGVCYVGSTTRSLRARECEHHSEFNNKNRRSFHSLVYTHFRDCGMTKDDIKCKLIEEVEDHTQLTHHESVWIDMCGDLNTFDSIPNLLKKEKLKMKYELLNSIINVCPCGGTWTYQHKARHFKTKKHIEWEDKDNKITSGIAEIHKILKTFN